MNPKFKAKKCGECGQSEAYLIPIDRGTAEIVIAIARAIREKGINVIHPRKELESSGRMTSNQVGNLSRPHRHGLIAKIKGNPGNWCLTTKGARFLRGEAVQRFAIVSKVTGHQEGYFEPAVYTITVRECLVKGEQWEGIDFEIVGGRIVRDLPQKVEVAQLL